MKSLAKINELSGWTPQAPFNARRPSERRCFIPTRRMQVRRRRTVAGYSVGYGLMFDRSSSQYMTQTTGGSPTDQKKITLVFNFKGAPALSGVTGNHLLACTASNNGCVGWNSAYSWRLFVRSDGTNDVQFNDIARDPTGHAQYVVTIDTTQATSSDRIKVQKNGAYLTYNTGTMPTLNSNCALNAASVARALMRDIVNGVYTDGVLSEVYIIDGQALDASDFGETSATTGQWTVKKYTGTYGNNGGYWKFDDGTSLTTLGYDSSGNGNHFTLTNFSTVAASQTLDTPTTNYARFSPLFANYKPTFQNANTRITNASGAVYGAIIPHDLRYGSYYAEFTCTTYAAGARIGCVSGGGDVTQTFISAGEAAFGEISTSGFDYYANSGNIRRNASSYSTISAWNTSGDRIGMATKSDGTNLRVWLRKNGGSWMGSGSPNPATDTDPTVTIALNGPAFMGAALANSAVIDVNTGFRTFTDTIPTGFKALCASNLPTPAVPKATNGFVSVLDTEANIETTLASARSGWTSYVEILKNRDASETWAWRFSHDASNEHAASTTDTYQARSSRTMSGSNKWNGYALRVGAAYGVAAGSASHTNGAATTVTHSLGVTRNAVLLFSRAGGDIYFYHPDLTAGSLLKLNTTGAQAASTSITSVGSNSFQIGSGMATGTYDYLVLAETDGFIKLFAFTGNASADGPATWIGMLPALAVVKRTDSANSHVVFSKAVNTTNVANTIMAFDLSSAESAFGTTDQLCDMNAGSLKLRTSSSGAINGSGGGYVGIGIAAAPFKYANAA